MAMEKNTAFKKTQDMNISSEKKSMMNSIEQFRVQSQYLNKKLSIYNIQPIEIVPQGNNAIEEKAYSIFGENATDYTNTSKPKKTWRSLLYLGKILTVIAIIVAVVFAVIAVGFLTKGFVSMSTFLKVAVLLLGGALVFLCVKEILL